MIVIIFGPPGSGKGTQCSLLAQKYNLKHISTGDLLRKEIREETEFGRKVKLFMAEGLLVPDELIIGMLMNDLDLADGHYGGILLDGFPRTIAQADALEKNLERRNKKTSVLIDLRVDNEELVNRLLLRGYEMGRMDDDLETIKKRLMVYGEKTFPVKEYYKNIDRYLPVDGNGEVEDIFKLICLELDKIQKLNT
ncbi:MAG TPA: adenylate kinase [Paludibacter sp.]|nr:adenylate kinase [Paludibacter sp.]